MSDILKFAIHEQDRIIEADAYASFSVAMDKSKNLADAYVELEDSIDEKIEGLKIEKTSVDAEMKGAKAAREKTRSFLVRYVEERGLDKVEGVNVKSVNYQPAKTTIETIAKRQIKVGTRYQNLDEVSRETLIEMLEAHGIKTREVAEKVEVTKPASVRVMR